MCLSEMFRRYWRDPHFWRWLWHDRVSFELKALTTAVAAALILGIGWFAADRLSSASAETTSPGAVGFVTVQKVITVHSAGGRVFRKLVPEVHRVVVTRTTIRTSVETVQGGVRTIRGKQIVVSVPGAPGKVTTIAGPTKTVVTAKLVPTTDVQTQTSTLTRVRTETQVQTNSSTVTSTVARTVTNTVSTTRTVTQPVTVTTTQVVTVTQTTTVPPVTVTVTQPILNL
jgi:hypothetical protein